jgi:hypothetical protein
MNHASRFLKKHVYRTTSSIVLVCQEVHEGPVAWYLLFLERGVIVEQESPEALGVYQIEGEVMVRKPVEQE